MEILKTIDEAAQALRLSKPTLRRHMATGKITFVKLGRRTLFRNEDIEMFILRGASKYNEK